MPHHTGHVFADIASQPSSAMNRFAPSLAVLLLICSLGKSMAAGWVLRTAAQEGAAPKYLIDKAGSTAVGGLCPEILRAIEGVDPAIHFEVDPRPTPLRRIEKALQEGHLDVICALLETPRRHQIAHRLSTPVYSVRERLVALHDDATTINSFDDLARSGGLVATQAGASYADKLRQHGVMVDESDTLVALRNIVRRRVRYYYGNELTCVYYIQAAQLGAQLSLVPGVLGETPSHFWAGRHLEPALVKRLDNALQKLKRNGSLDRIYKRYADMN